VALDTYSNLKSSIVEWSHREDVTDKLDDFIALAEQEMFNNRVEALIVRDQETRATASMTIDSRFVPLPDGFTSMRRLLIDDTTTNAIQYPLSYKTPEVLGVSPFSGCPSMFTVTSQLEFNCPADIEYNLSMQYMATPTALSSSNTTNDILTNYPSIYLAGSLWALYRWANDTESASGAYDDFISAIIGANQATREGRYGPSPVIRNQGYTV